ncbi:MAG: hypothetical protein ACYSWP_01360 [Planctomycetota bacterium]
MAALIILAFVSTNVMVVVSRNMVSVADLSVRMQAFEVARDNMEYLLGSETVSEQVEYGFSEKYPDIEWQTVVESFYEPMTSRLWIKGTCLAEYEDSSGEIQKVEFTHWLTNLTKQQVMAILNKMNAEQQLLAESDQLIADIEMAAEYADVEPEVIQAWVDGSMPTAGQGGYLKMALDYWKEYDGDPPPEALTELTDEYYALTGSSFLTIRGGGGGVGGGNFSGSGRISGPRPKPGPKSGLNPGSNPGPDQGANPQDGSGLPMFNPGDLENMSMEEIMRIFYETYGGSTNQ